MFYILGLSLKKVRLFLASEYEIQELDVAELVPEDIDVALSYYDFDKSSNPQSPSQWEGGSASPVYHGKERNKGYNEAYLEEYFRHINDSLDQVMVKKDLPVVLAAVDYLHPIYRKTNKILHLHEGGIKGNPDELQPKALFEKGIEIIRPHLDKQKFEQMEKYRALASTGKASHDICEIAPGALDGRIETLFAVQGTHLWGTIHQQDHSVQLHEEHQENDQCLVSKAVVQTILHGGNAYFVDKESLPEDFAEAKMAAVFRW